MSYQVKFHKALQNFASTLGDILPGDFEVMMFKNDVNTADSDVYKEYELIKHFKEEINSSDEKMFDEKYVTNKNQVFNSKEYKNKVKFLKKKWDKLSDVNKEIFMKHLKYLLLLLEKIHDNNDNKDNVAVKC
jgi:hypothetical protein